MPDDLFIDSSANIGFPTDRLARNYGIKPYCLYPTTIPAPATELSSSLTTHGFIPFLLAPVGGKAVRDSIINLQTLKIWVMEKNLLLWGHVAEIDLVYKTKAKSSDRPLISSSLDAYRIFLELWEEGKLELVEQFKVLFLNRANKVLCFFSLSTGGITGTVADPRLVYSAALKLNTCSLILAHNHPSGSLKPSAADEELTMKIKGAGNFLDIKVLDHLILTSDGYFSFADEGLL